MLFDLALRMLPLRLYIGACWLVGNQSSDWGWVIRGFFNLRQWCEMHHIIWHLI